MSVPAFVRSGVVATLLSVRLQQRERLCTMIHNMDYDESYLSSDSSLEIGNRVSWHWLTSVLSLGRDLVNILDLLPGESLSRPVAVMLDLTLDLTTSNKPPQTVLEFARNAVQGDVQHARHPVSF